jgi:hypothetical protein
MRLLRAYTDRLGGFSSLVLQFADNPPVAVDMWRRRALVEAGTAIMFAIDPDAELQGFESFRIRVYSNDPESEIEIRSKGSQAASRDPLVIELVRQFLTSTDDLTFEPGVQLYPYE